MAADLTWPADRMAKFIDVNPRRLQQLVQLGIVERSERNRYNPFVVTVAYIRWLRDQRSAPPDVEGERSAVEAKMDRARRTKAEADQAEAEAAEKLGLLMFKKDAQVIWADAVIELRRLIQSKKEWDSDKLLVALAKIKPGKT